MANDNDPWKRYRDKLAAGKPTKRPGNMDEYAEKPGALDTGGPIQGTELEDAIQKLDVMIEQVNNLYQMYFTGVERRPPVERRKLLDDHATKLAASSKPTLQGKFRANTALARYNTHCERWDKRLRSLESGALRRRKD